MKTRVFFSAFILSVLVLLAFRLEENKKQTKSFDVTAYKKKNILRCSPDWNELKEWLEETNIPPIPGAGIYKWKISTKNDSAQAHLHIVFSWLAHNLHLIFLLSAMNRLNTALTWHWKQVRNKNSVFPWQ